MEVISHKCAVSSRNEVLNETPSKIECDTAKLILLFMDAVLSDYCKTSCEETVVNDAAKERCMSPFTPISNLLGKKISGIKKIYRFMKHRFRYDTLSGIIPVPV
ncbi:hypothetical protein AVEN_250201-1 [Araneus ventricosus]|uniref:Uncharacterized protein n=1 Tax=Araneus ventricosus TaxID=182803 RepID=A0A4Y2FEQ6_ARAVE|nr:hypothetical protein AVEN_250201-1 [Araneus ventricosus]